MIYLVVSIIAFATHPLVYSLLLLDIIKRDKGILTITKPFYSNLSKYIQLFVLAIIFFWFYSIIGFTALRDDFRTVKTP